jgi:hypothetical protein
VKRLTNVPALIKQQEARFRSGRHTMREGLGLIAKDGLDDARSLSKGPLDKRQLKLLGHPFARRRGVEGRGAAPLLPINKQSGLFLRSFELVAEKAGEVYGLYNRAGYWKFLNLGTHKMVARPLKPEVEKRFKARRHGLFRAVMNTHRR